ncbi:MAG TPA: metalloregulator ArsR/SmtB family transcription factor [Candidatus Paceibacterota bacterium]|nr:metalloregulator ArsR/SmtB family transcription factor [Candidatus Paceibacterota bacterium]
MPTNCKEIERFGKGIGNEARYRILQALLKGRKTVSELVTIARLSQPAVSQHLKTLKASELVIDERRGKEVFYAVNAEYLLELLARLSQDARPCMDGRAKAKAAKRPRMSKMQKVK